MFAEFRYYGSEYAIVLASKDAVNGHNKENRVRQDSLTVRSLIARFMGPTWGPYGADRTQVGPMLAPWTLLSGMISNTV